MRHLMAEVTTKNRAAFTWSVADLLRRRLQAVRVRQGDTPLTVLRRLDCVLEPTKAAVLKGAEKLRSQWEFVDAILEDVAGEHFYNTFPLDFRRLLDDPGQIAGNMEAYVAGFSVTITEKAA